uniref:Uncharacterized protein n=1 Tax=Crocodylus porosus TaxID=8502 RepID=A0A7M4FHZ5_CROPO
AFLSINNLQYVHALFPALGCGRFVRKSLGGGGQAGPFPPSPALRGLRGAEGLEVDLLVERAAPQAEVKALVVSVLHSVHDFLGHAHGKGEVAAHLPHHNRGADVLGLDLNMLARNFLRDLQAVGAVLVAAVLGAIREGSRELVHLCLVHFLVHTFLEALEDDGELSREGEKRGRGNLPQV